MNVILFDDPAIRPHLLPFTFTRPVANLRVGILTIDEKWSRRLGTTGSYLTEGYLQKKFTLTETNDNLLINGAVCPTDELLKVVTALKPGEKIQQGEVLVAARTGAANLEEAHTCKAKPFTGELNIIDHNWKIYQLNGAQIRQDFSLITKGKKSNDITDPHTKIYGHENLFVEEGVTVLASIINASNGPVYLGKDSVVQEGAIIRGAFALCEGGHVNMGAKVRGDTTVGPYSKIGGEVSASVLFSYSNKAHDGFLGCSVIGEWCNLGADTNTSNLKNSYDNVKAWSHAKEAYVDSGLQFLGLMMGDHGKCSINTMFNTGTTTDVSANIFGEGFPPNYIPSFSWGGSAGLETYRLDKAIETASRVVARRNIVLDSTDIAILTHIFSITEKNREKK